MTPSMFSQKTSHKHVVLKDAITKLHEVLYVNLDEVNWTVKEHYKVGDGQRWHDVCKDKEIIVSEAKSL